MSARHDRTTLIERQHAALAAGYTADPDNGRRVIDPALTRRYVYATYEPADCVYFCPGCRAEWNRGVDEKNPGWWSWTGDRRGVARDVLHRTMREHETYYGPEHHMRIVEEPEGVPVPEEHCLSGGPE